VEQQVPLLDAKFFAHFVESLGRELGAMQLTHGTDIGTDELWCRAAGHCTHFSFGRARRDENVFA
jgi:hypothetical protein